MMSFELLLWNLIILFSAGAASAFVLSRKRFFSNSSASSERKEKTTLSDVDKKAAFTAAATLENKEKIPSTPAVSSVKSDKTPSTDTDKKVSFTTAATHESKEEIPSPPAVSSVKSDKTPSTDTDKKVSFTTAATHESKEEIPSTSAFSPVKSNVQQKLAMFANLPIMGSQKQLTKGPITTSESFEPEPDPYEEEKKKQARRIAHEYKARFLGGPWAQPEDDGGKSIPTSLALLPRSPLYHPHLELVEKLTSDSGETSSKSIDVAIHGNGWCDLREIPDGVYKVSVSLTHMPRVGKIQATTTVVVKSGRPDPRELRLPLVPVRIVFEREGEPVPEGSPFTAKFNKKVDVSLTSVEDGLVSLVVPEGSLFQIECAGVKRKEPIEVTSREIVDAQDPKKETKSKNLLIADSAKECGKSVEYTSNNQTKAVILGDISGSMSYYNRMNSLKQSFVSIAKRIQAKGGQFALVAWDSWVEPFNKDWQTEVSKDMVRWVNSLKARGGNDMRYAIEQAIKQYPDANDFWVICDGDVSPFCLEGGKPCENKNVPKPMSFSSESSCQPYRETDWNSFRQRFPNVRFNFIAFDEDARRDEMTRMADECFEQALFR